jgi:hypothetical protein
MQPLIINTNLSNSKNLHSMINELLASFTHKQDVSKWSEFFYMKYYFMIFTQNITLRRPESFVSSTQRYLLNSWANPTIVSYNATVAKIYNATNSMARFQKKKIFFHT